MRTATMTSWPRGVASRAPTCAGERGEPGALGAAHWPSGVCSPSRPDGPEDEDQDQDREDDRRRPAGVAEALVVGGDQAEQRRRRARRPVRLPMPPSTAAVNAIRPSRKPSWKFDVPM